jgi:hypothetical protein
MNYIVPIQTFLCLLLHFPTGPPSVLNASLSLVFFLLSVAKHFTPRRLSFYVRAFRSTRPNLPTSMRYHGLCSILPLRTAAMTPSLRVDCHSTFLVSSLPFFARQCSIISLRIVMQVCPLRIRKHSDRRPTSMRCPTLCSILPLGTAT